MTNWRPLGIQPASFLLPRQPTLNPFWPVIACDQYTSPNEVWEELAQKVAGRPSSLQLIIPEAFLDRTEQLEAQALAAMQDYVARDLFEQLPPGFILVERCTQSGCRLGLMMNLDLEQYEYKAGSTSLIRATEQTVLSRIPPRLRLREKALLELSHVLLLADDKEDSLIGPLSGMKDSFRLLYDIELLMGGGRLRGWHIGPGLAQQQLAQALAAKKAALLPHTPLFVVGDGNHSLAAAKASWEHQKAGLSLQERENHPARFASVELVNLHDPALVFEPIHRVVFGASLAQVRSALEALALGPCKAAPDIYLLAEGQTQALCLNREAGRLLVEAVQEGLDQVGFALDYVHGEQALKDIVARERAVGILMPAFPKDLLFPTVIKEGRLPRKSFSMGQANEKRFYMEARKII